MPVTHNISSIYMYYKRNAHPSVGSCISQFLNSGTYEYNIIIIIKHVQQRI